MADKTPAKDKAPAKKKGPGGKLDIATCCGLVLALFAIVGGLVLEGGSLKDISQVTAALIVLGGTLGAVMVTTPVSVLIGAVKKLPQVFIDNAQSADAALEEIIQYATKARKSGIVSLEQDADGIKDPFLKKALNLAIDGMELKELRKMMELEISVEEQRTVAECKVYEAAGGYAPTIGIIGAVLGLIQVMKNLADIAEVGRGIGVAFVATVYGIGVANVFFLPAGAKIKARMQRSIQMQELVLEGVSAIVEGLNPKLLRSKLEVYARHEARPKAAGPAKTKTAAAPKPAPAKS
ncbi:MAG: flagellar motor protein [Acidobacteria bacterium]|nr:flagellar motor protein [Acidobacteriota bacterium]